ncbi:MAG: MotA/TolQ/ExbB proton channel family protein [Opitutaceae bacterium]|nr:MotA/TolQ/ExbB proton channel family protein [Opitutaceae bacterium]
MITQTLPLAFLLGDATVMEVFIMGKWIMWPLLLVSFIVVTVVIERLVFIFRENASREPEVVEKMLESVERGDTEGALAMGAKSRDFIAKILTYSLSNRQYSLSNAFIRASGQELARFSQGMATLDTCITAAPLLGLLGTVTGMMATFGALGTGDIGAAAGQITGGVAEALIATAGGLFIAILGLLPFNYLNARAEKAKSEVADVSHALEILIKKSESGASLDR